MFYDLFNELCKEKGVSVTKATVDIGLSRTIGTKWKNTGATPQGDTLNKIASYFGVSTDYLLGKQDQKEKAPAKAEAEEDPLSQVSFALFGTHDEIDEDILSDVREFARFKLEQKRKAAEEKK